MVIDSTYKEVPDLKQTGGKAKNLLLLKQQGYPVPDFLILPVSFFEGRQDKEAIIAAVENLKQKLKAFFPGVDAFAVRSSAVAEDGLQHSFAGQFTSLLHVHLNDVSKAVATVYSSLQNASVTAYKQHAHMDSIKMAVVIQKMIPADAAGVGFGIHPLTGNKDERVINAIQGVGEALVSGFENGDEYIIRDDNITKKLAGEQAVLTDAQIQLVNSHIDLLGNYFKHPQDIEFAFWNNDFYILQSRPVTTTTGQGQKIVWDNSNIVESYPGLTLPLTFSFIQKMYEAVYRQFSMLLGVPLSKVERHAGVYANMLGLLNGRVYYNLNSWYHALAQLPGYSINAPFMEKMMGVKEKPPVTIAKEKAGLKGYWEAFTAVGCILQNLRSVKKQRDQFILDFESVYARFHHKDYSRVALEEIWKDYQLFEQMMVDKWKAPLVNDFFAMIYFGLLHKTCIKYFPGDKNLHNKLLSSSKDISTTEPLRRLPGLALSIAAQPELKNIFLEKPAADAWKELHQPGYENELRAVQSYINDWGERCVAELKLETVTYKQEPERLIAILQSYIKKEMFVFNAGNNYEREQAELEVRKALKGYTLRSAFFFHLLKKARYLVSNRENLRYYRTKGFGMVRTMMLAFGAQLEQMQLVGKRQDVFYLQLVEIEAIALQKMDAAALNALIKERKKDYALFESLGLPERIITYGKPDKIILPKRQEHSPVAIKNQLEGTACSPGLVQAKVRVVHHAQQLETLDGHIMVTYATDPGWVVLFPSASGILTERGSLLSHAAIVSREMGIPCIVGIENLLQQLKDGDDIIMDGSTGIVQIINRTEA